MTFTISADMLQFLVLSVIWQEDSYGYQVSQRIRRVSNAKDSTLYPILKRMQEEGMVSVYDRQIQGRNRRYYRITDQGKQLYDRRIGEWEEWKKTMDEILKGGEQR